MTLQKQIDSLENRLATALKRRQAIEEREGFIRIELQRLYNQRTREEQSNGR